jgi:hypothetical protein
MLDIPEWQGMLFLANPKLQGGTTTLQPKNCKQLENVFFNPAW